MQISLPRDDKYLRQFRHFEIYRIPDVTKKFLRSHWVSTSSTNDPINFTTPSFFFTTEYAYLIPSESLPNSFLIQKFTDNVTVSLQWFNVGYQCPSLFHLFNANLHQSCICHPLLSTPSFVDLEHNRSIVLKF